MTTEFRKEPSEYQFAKPTNFHTESLAGVLEIQEQQDGSVIVRVGEKEHVKELDLSPFLPEGSKLVGTKKVSTDNRYMGMAGIDTSLCDDFTKSIILSETEMYQYGWKYMLVILHEIGHANRNTTDLQAKTNLQQAFRKVRAKTVTYADVREYEKRLAEDEQLAWEFALKTVKTFQEQGYFDVSKEFADPDSLKEFLEDFFLHKCLDAEQIVQQLDISETERDALIEEVYQFYTSFKPSFDFLHV